MMRRQYLLTLVLVLLLVHQIHTPILKTSSSNSDCLYFLALLNIVLDHAIKGDSTGELMARYLVNASTPADLRDLHVRTYKTIIDYYRALHGVSEGLQNTALILRNVQERLDSIEVYASRLGTCSHDPEAAKTLRVYVSMKLNTLREQVYQLIIKSIYETQNEGLYTIKPLKDSYSPGEVVEVIASKNIQLSAVETYEWPNLVKISEFKPSEVNETHYLFKVELPPASLIESLGLRLRDVRQCLLALYLRLTNGSYMLAGFTRIQYRLPGVQLGSPSVIEYGSPLRVTIISDESYNASLYFNDFKVATLLLKPGSTTLTIDYYLTNYTIGLNKVKLCVNATTETFSRCLDRPVYIEPLYPHVRVIAENVSIAWLGYVALLINNVDQKDLHVKVFNYGEKSVYVPSGGTQEILVYGGFLPVQLVNLVVEIEPLNESYRTLNLNLSIYVVNMPVIIALIFITIFITTLVSGHERSFIPVVVGVWRRVQHVPRRAEALARNFILKPYELGLNSRVALLYYSLLKKLKLRLPTPNETLREHYVSISHSTHERLRRILWRFLLLVERDLYSSKKPTYQEAETTYRGALSAAGEE